MRLEHNGDISQLELQVTDCLCLRLDYLPWVSDGYPYDHKSYHITTPGISLHTNMMSGNGNVHFLNIHLTIISFQIAWWTGQDDLDMLDKVE